MGIKQQGRSDADKVVRSYKSFEVGDLVLIKNSLQMLGVISEVKGKVQGANHDWNKYYYMVIPAGASHPMPVWNEELELVRKAK
tara:strand:+ start:1426 stop:1677 length:252 start_codon:yes stop_codon:yes gene_type:complete